MAIPTFNGTPLASGGQRDRPGSPEVRSYAETLPGVDGRFVQPAGRGGRRIVMTAVLQATGDTPAEAHENLKTALRAKQALADGRTVAAYVGTDGHSYDGCMLTAYRAVGRAGVSPGGPPYRASVAVSGELIQLST